MCSAKNVVLIHGLSPKPGAQPLQTLWRDALLTGLRRDHPVAAKVFDALPVELAYYGDLLPPPASDQYDAALDLADRQRALQALAQLDKPKRFRRGAYEAIPGKSSFKEFAADLGAPLLRGIGLGSTLVNKLLPNSAVYWSKDSEYRRSIQERVLQTLAPALQTDGPTLLISHGFGSVLAYDCLWRLSHEDGLSGAGRLHTWLTLGSPLADDSVRGRLLGSSSRGTQRHPANLINWHNVAAEDDFVCHDETVANDYAAMLTSRQLSVLQDHLIYNLAVRFGRSNPHCSVGYLTHPKIAGLVAHWLQSPQS